MSTGLGREIAVYVVAPQMMQRAVFIAVLSFLFFLSTMIVYYLRSSLLFFLLATAFLLIYIATMLSLFSLRRGMVRVYQRGLAIRRREISWPEILSVSDDGTIKLRNQKTVSLPKSLSNLDSLIIYLRGRVTP